MAAAKAAASVASSALGALRLDFARPIFVIEHAEGPLGDWSLLEYRHASARVGGARNMMFTSVSRPEDAERLRPYGRVEAASAGSLGLERVCVLDPKAEQELVPEDAARFDYVVIGGILGTFDFNGRTGREVSSKCEHAQARDAYLCAAGEGRG
jgi:ribosome biogenesis SPOUT family RNA methylase Rps3